MATPTAALRVHAVQAIEALAARGDRADDNALPRRVGRLESRAEFFDDPDRLMSEHEAGLDRILPAHNVHVGATDGRGRDANDRLPGARRGSRLLHGDAILALEHDSFHSFHGGTPVLSIDTAGEGNISATGSRDERSI